MNYSDEVSLSQDSENLLEDPYALLALCLACPYNSHVENIGESKTTYGIHHNFLARPAHLIDSISSRLPHSEHSSPVIATKDTYFLACIILDHWLHLQYCNKSNELPKDRSERDSERYRIDQQLYNECLSLMQKIATHRYNPSFESPLPSSLIDSLELISKEFYSKTIGQIQSRDASKAILERAKDALKKLEDNDLLVDPAFAGFEGAIILLGLLPLRFSNRTGRGEQIFRELKIQAAFWDFAYASYRPIQGKKYDRTWAINIRGIKLIRKLLTDMALQFVQAEADDRRKNNEAVMQPPSDIGFPDGRETE